MLDLVYKPPVWFPGHWIVRDLMRKIAGIRVGGAHLYTYVFAAVHCVVVRDDMVGSLGHACTDDLKKKKAKLIPM